MTPSFKDVASQLRSMREDRDKVGHCGNCGRVLDNKGSLYFCSPVCQGNWTTDLAGGTQVVYASLNSRKSGRHHPLVVLNMMAEIEYCLYISGHTTLDYQYAALVGYFSESVVRDDGAMLEALEDVRPELNAYIRDMDGTEVSEP